jgi:hypothetical protein
MSLTIRRTGLLNTAHLPNSFKPRKGKTLVVHIENPAWSDPPAHPDYTVLHCTGLGRRWAVEARYITEPPKESRLAANDEEKTFIIDARNMMIEHSLTGIEFYCLYPLIF